MKKDKKTQFSSFNRTSEFLHEQVHSIEQELEKAEIDRSTRDDLFLELTATHDAVQSLRETASTVNAFAKLQRGHLLDELQEQIKTLYGRIDARFVNHEVAKIQKEAKILQKSLVKGDMKKISKVVDTLKGQIFSLRSEYRLLAKDCVVVASAENYVKRANALLHGEPSQAPSEEASWGEILISEVLKPAEVEDLFSYLTEEEIRALFSKFS